VDEENPSDIQIWKQRCAPTRVSGAQRPADSETSSSVAYYGDAAARSAEGFVLALELLELNVPMVDGVTRDQAEEGE
jgi:hypothetical protein